MPPKSDATLISAIQKHKLLRFNYEGLERVCEPHIFGTCNGKRQVLCYQLEGGTSSGTLPQWRRFEFDQILSLHPAGGTFPGPRPVPHPHSLGWDQFIVVVTG